MRMCVRILHMGAKAGPARLSRMDGGPQWHLPSAFEEAVGHQGLVQ